jgi:hypothetical protein
MVQFLPHFVVPDILEEMDGSLLSGHDGLLKTKERALQCFYWPNMDTNISAHLNSCHH